MNRESLRVEALKSIDNCPNIAIQAATGAGKSKIAIDIVTHLAIEDSKVLVVVNEVAHIKNWESEMNKWNFNHKRVTIVCYASLKKFKDTEWKAVIYDEAHHLSTPIRQEIAATIKSEHFIFLSATLKNSFIEDLEEIVHGKIKSVKMSLQDAISSNVLPEPKIFLVPLTLDDADIYDTVVEGWGKKENRKVYICNYIDRWKYRNSKKTIPNAWLHIRCTMRQKYMYLTEKQEIFKKAYITSRNEAVKNKWMNFGSARKTYLGSLKTDVARLITNSLGDKRYICFCSCIEQADSLNSENSIHSKKRNSLEIIDKFNEGKISNLFAVGMLQEGQNLTDIQAGVIIQLDGSERPFIQKFGRTMRAESPVQYIIYFKGTRDEEYLNTAIENIDNKYIKEISLEELIK